MLEHLGFGGNVEPFFHDLLKVYIPRQVCMFGESPVIWLHAISDLLIGLAYYSIPVALAASAREALTLLGQEQPHILISDIGMPHEDGYWLIQQVRSLPPEEGGSIPALALTALARAEDRIRALRAGFQAHTAKPVETTELLYIVAGLAGRTARRPRRDVIP